MYALIGNLLSSTAPLETISGEEVHNLNACLGYLTTNNPNRFIWVSDNTYYDQRLKRWYRKPSKAQ